MVIIFENHVRMLSAEIAYSIASGYFGSGRDVQHQVLSEQISRG